MRIFVCEFVTGGGFAGQILPASLALEGKLMFSALVEDLMALPDVEIVVAQDPRLDLSLPGKVQIKRMENADPWCDWQDLILDSDATWPIAPETGGALECLSRGVLDAQRILLGSRPESVAIAASKSASARALAQAGIAVVPCYTPDSAPRPPTGGWIVKPDDGAGSEETLFFTELEAAIKYMRRVPGHVIQTYVEGRPISLAMLCRDGNCALLSGNEQIIEHADGRLKLAGIKVNALTAERPKLANIAAGITRVLPGLWGYVGVDLIMTKDEITVVDINPRLTTTYVGLRKLLADNIAGSVLRLVDTRRPIDFIERSESTVLVDLRNSEPAPTLAALTPGYV